MNTAKRSLSLAQLGYRQFSRTVPNAKEAVPERIIKLKEKQKKFGIDDGVPVYLKGGFGDKILFQLTLGTLAVSLGMTLQTFVALILK